MHYQWRNAFLITRSSATADAVTRRIAAMVSCPIGVRISTGPNRRRLCRLVTARNTVPKGLPRSCESFSDTSQAGAEKSNHDRACAELKSGTIRHPTTATAILHDDGRCLPAMRDQRLVGQADDQQAEIRV